MSEFSLDNVNSMYMDVLKEIGNIGAGNATTAIAGHAWHYHENGSSKSSVNGCRQSLEMPYVRRKRQ